MQKLAKLLNRALTQRVPQKNQNGALITYANKMKRNTIYIKKILNLTTN